MVTAILDPDYAIEKDDLMQLMSAEGIDCRPFFRPLSSLPAYAGTQQAQQAQQRNSVSYRLSPYGINLPCGMNMTEEKVAYVCAALKRILRRGE
jgi:perosamine synthetase